MYIHVQGYPVELLPMTVSGIPSMHICLDFLPQLVTQPHTDKQVSHIATYIIILYSISHVGKKEGA